ncbi:hypothetical protein PIB30_051186 [Stylosanthes scabra]|uniref:Uncharacterized protein n=1 Tax=Stylosanthes scabra TaxID=79078 RepID=A0ABU6WHF1_9FABA|nr:hypothetical protein [Stylosanthes scabra]
MRHPYPSQIRCLGPWLTILCRRGGGEEELARQAGCVYLRWDGGNWWFVPQFSMTPDHTVYFWWDCWRIRNKGAPHEWIRDDLWNRLVEFWQQEDFKKLKQVNKKNRASSTCGSLHTGGSTMYEATRERMDRGWVDMRSENVNDVFIAELKRLQEEHQAIIGAGSPEPPIDKDAVWTQIAGGCKRGRICGMGVVPSHKYPHLFADHEDDDTTSGPPDLREQVTLLNKEISQQAEAHVQSLASVEAVYAEKMRSNRSSSAAMPDMPPPPPPPPSPPPPARSQSPPPRPDQGTSSPQLEDDPYYV